MTGAIRDSDVSEVWTSLSENQNSLLIDVRTKAEWSFVGVPDLSTLGKQAILKEWQSFPTMAVNPAFVTETTQAIEEVGGDKTTELFFLCRSGVRSLSAAAVMIEAGFENCFNVTGGFEGPPDDKGHRGTVDGWKHQSLPWKQS